MSYRPDEYRGRGIRHFAQELLSAAVKSLAWTDRLYNGTLTQMLTGDFSKMNDKEQEQFKEAFKERTTGVDNLGELLFVPSEKVHLQTITLDPQQMSHVEILKDIDRKVVNQLFGIPAQLFNLNESGTQVTYTTVPALAERLYQDALLIYITALEDGLSRRMMQVPV